MLQDEAKETRRYTWLPSRLRGAKAICTELFSPEIGFNLVSLSRKSHLASKLENVSTLTCA